MPSKLNRFSPKAVVFADIDNSTKTYPAALREIEPDTILEGFCAPEACHAGVVARGAAWAHNLDAAAADTMPTPDTDTE